MDEVNTLAIRVVTTDAHPFYETLALIFNYGRLELRIISERRVRPVFFSLFPHWRRTKDCECWAPPPDLEIAPLFTTHQ